MKAIAGRSHGFDGETTAGSEIIKQLKALPISWAMWHPKFHVLQDQCALTRRST